MIVDHFRQLSHHVAMITPAKCRAARALIDWSQAKLASESNLSSGTIKDYEAGRRTPTLNNLAAIQRALETVGVRFTERGVELLLPHGR